MPRRDLLTRIKLLRLCRWGEHVNWRTNEYAKYESVIRDAERRHGIPENLLARLLFQLSHYEYKAIVGFRRSMEGAVGIAMLTPADALLYGPVDRTNAHASIECAARKLVHVKGHFHTWKIALVAYNWGIGNTTDYLHGKKKIPDASYAFAASIVKDAGVSA